MNRYQRIAQALVGLLIVFLAACTPMAGAALPSEVTSTPPPATSELPPAAVLAAQAWLAGRLGAAVVDVAIGPYSREEWRDSCLGLGRPEEACLQAITPGWKAAFTVAGHDYAVRTDEIGAYVRLEEPLTDLPAAIVAAQVWLASRLGVNVEDVVIGAVAQEEWRDSCLGLGRPEESCLQTMTPGWRAMFTVAGQPYAVRTDEAGTNVRLEEAKTTSELAGTAWDLVSFGAAGAGTPVRPAGAITLQFDLDGRAGGSAGCNQYGGAYQASGGALSFGGLASTRMACAEAGRMEQEQRYLEALQAATGYVLAGDRLTLIGAGEALHFVRHGAPEIQVQAQVPGIIDFHADGSQGVLTAPDRVAAGQTFEITISTFGGGCEEVGEAVVVRTLDGAVIFVYDTTTAVGPEVACTAELKRLAHTANLRFDEPGAMRIEIWGRRVGPETGPVGAPVVLALTVVVE
ncbi:MAG: META domain-containing protein [Anaerolineales bacterium]|nr:META domain-containing protein [Anaerolineales bacterium]